MALNFLAWAVAQYRITHMFSYYPEENISKHMIKRNIKGFTLIELLVVIAVLGVLAAGLLVLINPAGQMAKARDAGRKSAIRQIAKALDSYSAAYGAYPIDSSCPTGCWAQIISNVNSVGPNLINSGDAKVIPRDPNDKDGSDYYNRYNWGDQSGMGIGSPCFTSGPGVSYAVWAWLENSNDPDVSHNCATGLPFLSTDSSGKTRGIYMIMNGKKL